MSRPSEALPAKLIVSLFSPRESLLEEVEARLEGLFGPVERKTPPFFFDRTTYYAREMGSPLHRRLLALKDLIHPDRLPAVKLATNDLEAKTALADGRRQVNIDPGYLTAERFVLATGKNFTHRIHLSAGIYADLTLIYQKGTYRPLEWTYPDYGSGEIITWLNDVRKGYILQVRGEGEP